MMNDLLVYRMMMANPAPSSMPSPLLHFTLDPRMHRFVANSGYRILHMVLQGNCFIQLHVNKKGDISTWKALEVKMTLVHG